MSDPVDLNDVAAGITEPWKPVDVVVANDAIVRMARLHGGLTDAGFASLGILHSLQNAACPF